MLPQASNVQWLQRQSGGVLLLSACMQLQQLLCLHAGPCIQGHPDEPGLLKCVSSTCGVAMRLLLLCKVAIHALNTGFSQLALGNLKLVAGLNEQQELLQHMLELDHAPMMVAEHSQCTGCWSPYQHACQ
jgi:hypothetical protein